MWTLNCWLSFRYKPLEWSSLLWLFPMKLSLLSLGSVSGLHFVALSTVELVPMSAERRKRQEKVHKLWDSGRRCARYILKSANTMRTYWILCCICNYCVHNVVMTELTHRLTGGMQQAIESSLMTSKCPSIQSCALPAVVWPELECQIMPSPNSNPRLWVSVDQWGRKWYQSKCQHHIPIRLLYTL